MMRLNLWVWCLVMMWPMWVANSYAKDDNELKNLVQEDSKNWILMRKDLRHNISTYFKREDDKQIRSFRAEGIYNNSLDAAARHQLDVNNYKNWFMNMEESILLKKVSNTEFYYYFKLKTPMGVTPYRDAVVNVKITPYNLTNGSLILRYTAVPDWLPPKPPLVRMPAFEVMTRLTPIEDNKVREETEGYANPGGSVPTWMINYLQRQMPYNNLLGRQRDIPNYENLTSPTEFKYKE